MPSKKKMLTVTLLILIGIVIYTLEALIGVRLLHR